MSEKKVSKKVSPHKELLLEEQGITQATTDRTQEEMLVTKRCTL